MSGRHASRLRLAKENRRRRNKRKAVRMLLIGLATLVLVYFTGIYGNSLAFFGDFLSSGMTLVQFGDGWPVEMDLSGFRQAEEMGTAVVVLTDDQLLAYSPTAKQIMSYSHSMSDPVMVSSPYRTVIYDMNDTTFKVMNGHNLLFQQEMDSGIVHIAISDYNRLAVTTHSSSFNGEVTVFNYNMNKRFTWYCANGYPIYSSLSSNGKKLAVSTAYSDGGLLKSRAFVIDSSKGEELFSIDDGNWPMRMIFLRENELLICYSGKLVLWDVSKQRQSAEYDLDGYLQAVDFHNGKIAVVSGSLDEKRPSTLVVLDSRLQERGAARQSRGARSVMVDRSRVYVLTPSGLLEYDKDLNLVGEQSTGKLSKTLVDYRGGILVDSTRLRKIEKTKSGEN